LSREPAWSAPPRRVREEKAGGAGGRGEAVDHPGGACWSWPCSVLAAPAAPLSRILAAQARRYAGRCDAPRGQPKAAQGKG
jgi:hypothetical protein